MPTSAHPTRDSATAPRNRHARVSAFRAFGIVAVAGLQLAGASAAEVPKSETTGTPDIEVIEAKLDSGRLQIAGYAKRTATIRVEGTTFKARADPGKTFIFNLAFRTSDCRVTLTTDTGSLTVPVRGCARGTQAQGKWAPGADYREGDVVTFRDSAWVAQRANSGSRPTGGDAKADGDWAIYAEGGAKGLAGRQGAAGPKGVRGERGPEGPVGRRGPRGPQGDDGESGAPGGQGPQGMSGVYAGAHVLTRVCESQAEATDYESEDYPACIVACPAGETAVTGWGYTVSEGSFGGIDDPRLVNNEWYDGDFDGQYVVSVEVFSLSDAATVAIACVPEIESPVTPVPRFDDP